MKYPTFLTGFCVVLAIFASSPTSASAQYENDTKTVTSTIEALYASISGEAGEPRDWDRFRNLFAPKAQLIPIAVTPDSTYPVFFTPDEYIMQSEPYFEANGFYEKEVSRTEEAYDHMVHAFSTYESFKTAKDTEPFMRGINSIQLMHDGDRWYVINIMWNHERPGKEIPEKYLD